MRTIYCLLLLLCPYLSSAQVKNMRPVSTGDQVPAIAFTQMLNSKVPVVNTAQYKGKLLILDFWASWCSGCIKKLPLLDSMQRLYTKELAVVLVNTVAANDSREKIEKLLKRLQEKTGREMVLPVAMQDTVADKMFPHKALPHYVWINKQGICIAITGMDEITPANIKLVLQKDEAAFALKDDYTGFDKHEPLFVQGNGGDGGDMLYRSTWNGHIAGVGSSSIIKRDSHKKISRVLYCNTPLLHLFKFAWQTGLPANRTLYPAALSSVFNLATASDADLLANSYTYELVTPPLPAKTINRLMQEDLMRFTGLTASVQKIPTPCYVLTADTAIAARHRSAGGAAVNKLYDPDEQYMVNRKVETLAGFLDGRLDKPVVNETGIAYPLDIAFTYTNFSSLTETQQALKGFGFMLTAATRLLDNFIITQKQTEYE